MSKSAFIDRVAAKGNLSPGRKPNEPLNLVFGEIEAGLKASKKEGSYTIGTLGTFSITKRGARMGRNPRTGEAIKIKASKSLRFKPARNLRTAAGC